MQYCSEQRHDDGPLAVESLEMADQHLGVGADNVLSRVARRPENRKLNPKDWRAEISPSILARAGK